MNANETRFQEADSTVGGDTLERDVVARWLPRSDVIVSMTNSRQERFVGELALGER